MRIAAALLIFIAIVAGTAACGVYPAHAAASMTGLVQSADRCGDGLQVPATRVPTLDALAPALVPGRLLPVPALAPSLAASTALPVAAPVRGTPLRL